jgi:hypothetical protein
MPPSVAIDEQINHFLKHFPMNLMLHNDFTSTLATLQSVPCGGHVRCVLLRLCRREIVSMLLLLLGGTPDFAAVGTWTCACLRLL